MAPELVGTFWRREKSLAHAGIRTPERPSRILLAPDRYTVVSNSVSSISNVWLLTDFGW